jgi:hypothetical protein
MLKIENANPSFSTQLSMPHIDALAQKLLDHGADNNISDTILNLQFQGSGFNEKVQAKGPVKGKLVKFDPRIISYDLIKMLMPIETFNLWLNQAILFHQHEFPSHLKDRIDNYLVVIKGDLADLVDNGSDLTAQAEQSARKSFSQKLAAGDKILIAREAMYHPDILITYAYYNQLFVDYLNTLEKSLENKAAETNKPLNDKLKKFIRLTRLMFNRSVGFTNGPMAIAYLHGERAGHDIDLSAEFFAQSTDILRRSAGFVGPSEVRRTEPKPIMCPINRLFLASCGEVNVRSTTSDRERPFTTQANGKNLFELYSILMADQTGTVKSWRSHIQSNIAFALNELSYHLEGAAHRKPPMWLLNFQPPAATCSQA